MDLNNLQENHFSNSFGFPDIYLVWVSFDIPVCWKPWRTLSRIIIFNICFLRVFLVIQKRNPSSNSFGFLDIFFFCSDEFFVHFSLPVLKIWLCFKKDCDFLICQSWEGFLMEKWVCYRWPLTACYFIAAVKDYDL